MHAPPWPKHGYSIPNRCWRTHRAGRQLFAAARPPPPAASTPDLSGRRPSFPDADDQLKVLQGAAGTLGLHIFVVNASNDSEIGRGFATIAQQRVHALIVAADPF